MDKSERHSKITGDFGESLLMYWLSKSGFEATLVDYTGIDIVAFHKATGRRLGISVKSRSRTFEKANSGMTIKGEEHSEKVIEACRFFACEPWVAFLYDRPKDEEETKGSIEVYLMHFDILQVYCEGFDKKAEFRFLINDRNVEKYRNDRNILKVNFEYGQSGDWVLPASQGA